MLLQHGEQVLNRVAHVALQAVACLLAFLPGAPLSGAEAPGRFVVERAVRELFLDDEGIERLEGLRRTVNPPERHSGNPVVRPDLPWEDRCQVYGTALYDEEAGLFKLWYLTTPRDRGLRPLEVPGGRRRPAHTTLAAYAFSQDGIHWAKPALEQFPYDGDRRNNLLDLGVNNCEGLAVLHEPREPDPERRWKAAYWDHGSGGIAEIGGKPYSKDGPEDGFCVAFSADGLVWKPSPRNPVIRKYCDTNQNLLFDPRLGKYVAFSRFGFGRRIARSESADFETWTEPALVLQCDAADGPGTQFYGAGIDLYEGLYLGMVWVYREAGDGKIDTQLAASRDGIRWTRVGDRAAWLALGPDESWEGGMVRSVGRIISRGDRLQVYYCGVHGPHVRPGKPEVVRKHRTAIGLLTQRRDGFVSLDAGATEGTALTRVFTAPAGDLRLNADASEGEVAVAACDESGSPLQGFERSEAVRGDLPEARVRWPGEAAGQLAGRRLRLRFLLRRAKLFSYWWE